MSEIKGKPFSKREIGSFYKKRNYYGIEDLNPETCSSDLRQSITNIIPGWYYFDLSHLMFWFEMRARHLKIYAHISGAVLIGCLYIFAMSALKCEIILFCFFNRLGSWPLTPGFLSLSSSHHHIITPSWPLSGWKELYTATVTEYNNKHGADYNTCLHRASF